VATVPSTDPAAPALRLRPAVRDDVPLILRFIRALAEYERLLDEVVATEAALEEHLFGAQPRSEVILAEWDGVSAGFALYFHNFSTFLCRPGIYLEDVFVHPEYRGRGIGKALLLELARIARQRGCGRFEWAVLNWNQPSIEFYESLGAQAMDEWRLMRVTGAALERLADQGEAAATGRG
jgi:GNAT superfamily N-acetyltransferase